ncbi:type IV pilus twitching motility protein PilT [Phycisphaera mikurensis]|uniref:Twitching motility protein n=1 Tax=Phycisphaera mikurensis (strain NBRC 102666 / KCTC 22515 / FYK2301M01) TaxID=1142394 RepID=I0IED4_PHYMF|nr:PilT/PilU family type 4a pilus ATPase [Phycisphaera mikurensis]MBB6441422.1 twitching motility protein PilT [Phycisphaera mikurensis]BAM03622.1 twitching motility protein [Phycisphaera mikurensis NBRC 102666]
MSANSDSLIAHDPLKVHATLADTPLSKYFKAAVKFGASDLIMRGGQPPKLRLKGDLKALDTRPPTVKEFNDWIHDGLSPEQIAQYQDRGSLDLGIDFDIDGEKHRFRVNIFLTRSRSAIAARRVSNEILNFEQLHLPPAMEKITHAKQGIILLCGVTGSGKSTTIAAMLDEMNKRDPIHILTIEDPIEYLFEDKKAMINQREIGLDCPDFATALRAMVRENPDVVLVGEMRDRETFEAALQAAETGHLVLGTIHASSATQAFGRIYDLFPAEEREAIRTLLAYQMQAFIYQKLLPTLKENMPRVPAVEILLQSPPVRKAIIEGREAELDKVIKDSRDMGMRTFVDSLVELVETEYIHPRVAQANAPSADEIKMRLRGISV